MALFFDGQQCPLCGIEMHATQHLFATSHFLGPDSDLYAYSDAVMHWDCYATWEHQVRFGRLYFEAHRRSSGQNPYWGIARADDQVLVTVNPNRLIAEVSVLLAATGSSFRVGLTEWEDWLSGTWRSACHHPVEYDALAAVIPLLQSRLPNAEQVVEAAGMQAKDESNLAAAGGLVERISYELACQKLAVRVATKGIACPGCGVFSTDYQYLRVEQVSESGPQSRLICRTCGHAFGPLDV